MRLWQIGRASRAAPEGWVAAGALNTLFASSSTHDMIGRTPRWRLGLPMRVARSHTCAWIRADALIKKVGKRVGKRVSL